jgi:hypothetical protein
VRFVFCYLFVHVQYWRHSFCIHFLATRSDSTLLSENPSSYMVLWSLKLFGRRRNYMGFITLMICQYDWYQILSQLWCALCKIPFCHDMLSWIFNRSAYFVELNDQSVSSLKSLTQKALVELVLWFLMQH